MRPSTPSPEVSVSIATIDELRQHLQWAIQLEHSTLPPYLCALYSIHPGTNEDAAEVIQSVFVEEMLHMLLAANLLNAVGGTPAIDRPDFIPRYPAYLPHSADAFLVPLARFAPDTIETFMRIERPAASDAEPEPERYDTIGQFYEAIEAGLRALCARLGEAAVFSGDPARQVTPDDFDYGGSGQIVPVYDLASALWAVDEIEEQGEGLKHAAIWDGDRDMFHPDREAVAHHFRYQQILAGRAYSRGDTPQSGPTGDIVAVDWNAVYPMRANPRSDDYPADSPVRAKMAEFNHTYSDLLRGLQRALDGDPTHLSSLVDVMFDLKRLAEELMQMPSGDGVTNAGPPFEYFPVP
jgi:ferritin-like protein